MSKNRDIVSKGGGQGDRRSGDVQKGVRKSVSCGIRR
jgi:hypothetical protein